MEAKSVSDKGSGNYRGSLTGSFRIIAPTQTIAPAKVTFASATPGETYDTGRKGFIYASRPCEPTENNMTVTLTVKEGNVRTTRTLRYGTDYTIIAYQNNDKAGTGKMILKGLGNYGGLKTVSFKIVQRK